MVYKKETLIPNIRDEGNCLRGTTTIRLAAQLTTFNAVMRQTLLVFQACSSREKAAYPHLSGSHLPALSEKCAR